MFRVFNRPAQLAPGTAALLIVLVAGAVQAQETGGPPDDAAVEEIVVTGSRLVRRDFSAPSPIASIDREALLSSGQATLESALNQMPQVIPDFDRTSNNPGNGTATVNLRGLGASRTLVMLDGKRIAPSWVGSAVDINTVPQSLIERVEIITGGAATVYGADAVAGVVNFILRDDFEGFGLDASTYATEQGDAESWDINLSYGRSFANGRGNLTVYGGYYDREPLLAGERAITAVPMVDTWFGVLEPSGSATIPEGIIFFPQVDWGDGPVRTTFDANGDPRPFRDPEDRYNWAPVNYLQVPLTRTSAGALLNYELDNGVESYAQVMFSRNEGGQTLAPIPAGDFYAINADNPVLTTATSQFIADNFVPLGGNLYGGAIGKRIVEAGPRIFNKTTDSTRIVAGFRGELNDSWDFDAWALYSRAEREEEVLNTMSSARMQQGLLVDPVTGECFDTSNGCVPVDLFGLNSLSPEAIDFLRLPPLINPSTREQLSLSGFVRGDAFSTWAGDVQVALGAEWRQDKGNHTSDDYLFTGDALGLFPDAPINGKESIFELYSEAIVPLADNAALAKYLALELGARHSRYDNAGTFNTWKAGFEWMPLDSLRVRSMLQRSVRAPNMAEAYSEQTQNLGAFVSFDSRQDPCSASNDPVGAGNLDKCVLTGMPADQVGIFEATVGYPVTFYSGGNPALRPEVADTFTFGFVFDVDALGGLQVSVDYYDLAVEETIGDLSADLACFDPLNTTGQFCSAIRRDPVSYNIVEFDEFTTNRGVISTRGIDTQIKTSFAAGAAGDIDIGIVWTHMLENTYQEMPFSTEYDCAGFYGWPCNFFKEGGTTFSNNRVTTHFDYTTGNLGVSLTWRWIEGTNNAAVIGAPLIGFPDPDLAIPSIGSKSYADLGFSYQFSDSIAARLSITNLLDTDPPMMADATWNNNTDTAMYDVFGRSYTLAFSLRY